MADQTSFVINELRFDHLHGRTGRVRHYQSPCPGRLNR